MSDLLKISSEIDDDIKLNVATLAGVFLLKLLAWSGAPESRTKDIDDLKFLLQHYFEVSEEEIYEKHLDLFSEDFVPEMVAARVLGRHLRPILKQSTRLRKKMLDILKENASNPEQSALGEVMVMGTDQSVAEVCEMLQEIIKGIED